MWFVCVCVNPTTTTAREEKAKEIFPRPASGALRPAVRGQTKRYNMKLRSGKGFSLDELKEAGIPAKLAPTIGIAIDWRRKNRSAEGLQENVKRLKAYKSKLVVFPRRTAKPKNGDSSAEELKMATQLKGPVLPITGEAPEMEMVQVTDEMKAVKAYQKLRLERMNLRYVGIREKRRLAKEAEEKDKAKNG